MKMLKGISLLFVLVLFIGSDVMAQGTGCIIVSGSPTGKRADNYFYTDCYADTGDDTTRLQTAITAAAGSTLIFNESNYQVSGHLDVPSNTTLEGMAAAEGSSVSKITLTGTNDSIFRIGPGVRAINIKNLGLTATSHTGTIGIEGSAGSGATASGMFHFSGMWIKELAKGIYVHSSDNYWQFDSVHVEDTAFDHCDDGIYLATQNSGWQMNNLTFGSGADQNAIHIEYGAYINMNLIVGNGTYSGSPAVPSAGEFISIQGHHGLMNMQNLNGEAYKKTLIINGNDSDKTFPIIVSNSDLQECHWVDSGVTKSSVDIKNATVVSQANSYACYGKVARPRVSAWTEVFSSGDKFCFDGTPECFDTSDPYDDSTRSGWAIEGGLAAVRSDSIADYNDATKALVDITSAYAGSEPFKPFLSLTNTFFISGSWYKYHYTFLRNSTTGRLEFNNDLNGNPNNPSSGYYFRNGPVQLHPVTASDLSGGYYSFSGGGDRGSMLYCSDCTAGTNPCSTSGGGGGALAVRIQSGNWACK